MTVRVNTHGQWCLGIQYTSTAGAQGLEASRGMQHKGVVATFSSTLSTFIPANHPCTQNRPQHTSHPEHTLTTATATTEYFHVHWTHEPPPLAINPKQTPSVTNLSVLH